MAMKMVRLVVLAMATGTLLTAAPATAAPLCRDLKGLFTPCPPGQPYLERHEHHRSKAGEPGTLGQMDPGHPSDTSERATSQDEKPHKQHRELVGQTHLCRDLKGLFTPCPR